MPNHFNRMKSEYHLERISKVIDFLRQHPEQDLSLEEVAAIAMFSKFHFHRIFKEITGETLCRYIKRLRMEKVCDYLEKDDSVEIKELWSRLGYNTASHFSKDFRRFYGCTPSQYQKQIRNKKINEIKSEVKIVEQITNIVPEKQNY